MAGIGKMNAIAPVAFGQPAAFERRNCKCRAEKRRAAIHISSALAQTSRMKIVCRLMAHERSVGELVSLTVLHQATVSQHLGRLRQEGPVSGRRDGRSTFYSIADLRVRPTLQAVWELRVAGFA
jgi:ArsR family transcriptional regulator, virulence genes transcriptional regulator